MRMTSTTTIGESNGKKNTTSTNGSTSINGHRHPSSGNTGGGPPPGSSGIFVFEADTAAFANRKRAARACASCQKRKKRCPHTFTKTVGDDQNGSGAEKVLPHLQHKEPIRFVGDLNPESIMTDLSTREKGQKRLSRVGVWVEQNQSRSDLQPRGVEVAGKQNATLPPAPADEPVGIGSRHAQRCAVEKYSKIERGRRTLTGHQKNYLQAVGAFRVLPKPTQDALVTTYIACMDPLLPIIDGKKFLREYTSGEASVFLVQAVCMVACKTEEAAPYLRLYEDGPLLDPIPFARSLHTGLDAAMKADLEADRFTKVQIMTMMSLHNDGPGGIEECSLYLTQAIHDAQTTGMHIDTPGRTRNDQGAQLWWTLWMLDKFNACLGGRPLMIAERDIDIKEPNPVANARSQALEVWMALGHLLDKVIEFYRPITDPDSTGWEQGFPSWTELTSKCDLDALLQSHQNALELCYNIIGILACRSGGPTTTSYNRRIACADRIQSLVSNQSGTSLPPIPLVPYAASLSLTVAYRGLRDHHTDSTKALADLVTRCEILEHLSSTWWTADAMAKLGRKAVKSLQQPPVSVQSPEAQGQARPDVSIADQMEAEVAACKYGPFVERKAARSGKQDNQRNADSAISSATDVAGNALHVLSDAAATHGLPGAVSTAKGKSKKLSRAERNNNDELQAKRRRVDPARHSLNANNHTSSNMASPNNTTSPNTLTDSSVNTPTLVHTSTAQTPASFDYGQIHQNPGSANGLLSPTSLPQPETTPGISAANIDPFNAFNMGTDYATLDNLFDGFFDLSLPTMFQDPLFDGAAYFSMDTDMDPGMTMGPEAFGFVDPNVNGNVSATYDANIGSGPMNMGMATMGGGMPALGANVGMGNLAASIAVNTGFGGMAHQRRHT